MSRNHGPDVTIELEGQTLPLHFDMACIHDFMDVTGVNILDGFGAESMRDPRNMIAMIWALAGGVDSGYATPRAMARAIDVADLGELSEAATKAMTRDRPSPKADSAPKA